MINLNGHKITEYKFYKKRVMCKCPFHVSKKNGLDLEISLEGKYSGYVYCFGCGRSFRIPMSEVERLRKMRGEVKSEPTRDWEQFQNSCIRTRFSMGVYPPFKVSVPAHAILEWGYYNNSHTFPMRNAHDKIVGIHRRWPDGNKGMLGKLGLFIPRVNFDPTKPLYVTEGASDLSVVLECGMQGIGRPNAKSCNKEVVQWCCLHNIEEIRLVTDSDDAGKNGGLVLFDLLDRAMTEDGKPAFSVDYNAPEPYNDLYDMFKEQGKERVKLWLGK